MKHLLLIACPVLLTSCSLASKLIQAPVRLLQSGVRTVSDARETGPPATREGTNTHGIAVKYCENEAFQPFN